MFLTCPYIDQTIARFDRWSFHVLDIPPVQISRTGNRQVDVGVQEQVLVKCGFPAFRFSA